MAIVRWAEKQSDLPTLSEAVRRLVEIGLAAKPARFLSGNQRARAADLAAKAIDGMIDPVAAAEEKATRKRRLTDGPSAFREVRVDRAKAKRK